MYWAMTGKNIPTLIPKKSDMGLRESERKQFKTPHEIYRKIPEGASDVVMDCVKETPAHRPGSMMEIIARLDVIIRKIFGSKYGNNVTSDN